MCVESLLYPRLCVSTMGKSLSSGSAVAGGGRMTQVRNDRSTVPRARQSVCAPRGLTSQERRLLVKVAFERALKGGLWKLSMMRGRESREGGQ